MTNQEFSDLKQWSQEAKGYVGEAVRWLLKERENLHNEIMQLRKEKDMLWNEIARNNLHSN